MSTWRALVKLEFENSGIEARSKEEFIKLLKDSFLEEYGLTLMDKEIVETEEL